MEEARRLQAEADNEGVHAYLRRPNARGCPNSRFLTATVLGVEQANRAGEINEMWRAREKEQELDTKLKNRAKDNDALCGDKNHGDSCKNVPRHGEDAYRSSTFASTSKRGHNEDSCYSREDSGLKDDEVEEFLRSRAKRGRGAIGSRMDEPDPYSMDTSLYQDAGKQLADSDAREGEELEWQILGPEKPGFIKSLKLPPEKFYDTDSLMKKHHSKDKKKKRSKEERSERKKYKKKKKCKHRQHRSRRSKNDSG